METQQKPSTLVIVLSVIYVIYLMSLPVLANISIAPLVRDHTVNAVFWGIFGMLGMPLAFAGIMSLNPFPRDAAGALMRTVFLPCIMGLWWWYLNGSLLDYFAIMLVFEFLAIFLSVFLMSFIPLKVYDPDNPKAGNPRTYWNILILQGIIMGGGFTAALVAGIWPWAVIDPYWHSPVTYMILLWAAVQYIISNFRWHKLHSYRWGGDGSRPNSVSDNSVSIEPVLLFVTIPWLISFIFINN